MEVMNKYCFFKAISRKTKDIQKESTKNKIRKNKSCEHIALGCYKT